MDQALALATEAMEGLRPGEPSWVTAASLRLSCYRLRGDRETAGTLAEEVLPVVEATTEAPAAELIRIAIWLALLGLPGAAERFGACAEERLDESRPLDAPAWHMWCAFRAFVAGHWQAFLESSHRAHVSYAQAGARRDARSLLMNESHALALLGRHGEAEQRLREVMRATCRVQPASYFAAMHHLGITLCRLGRVEEGITCERDAITYFVAARNATFEASARAYLATLLFARGSLAEARVEAQRAVAMGEPTEVYVRCLATLASFELALGHDEEALRMAREVLARVVASHRAEDGEMLARITSVEALHRTGRPEDARAALAIARDVLLARADRIEDPDYRESFLSAVAVHARILALAAEWSV
jgi:tetratricopeptide (TPR) repeat protein